MPRKDKDAKLAYQREWYARPGNRERTIEAVTKRKHTAYAGTCLNCGGPTVGNTKGKASKWCAKPECASVQRRLRSLAGWDVELTAEMLEELRSASTAKEPKKPRVKKAVVGVPPAPVERSVSAPARPRYFGGKWKQRAPRAKKEAE